jgi:hypothetical protein
VFNSLIFTIAPMSGSLVSLSIITPLILEALKLMVNVNESRRINKYFVIVM